MRSLRAAVLTLLIASLAPAARTAEWIDTAKSGDVTYFLFAYPAEVARFDASTATWLPRIPLAATPIAIAADAQAVYIASGASVLRIPLAGGPSVPLGTVSTSLTDLAVGNGALIAIGPGIYDSGEIWNLDKLGAGILATRHSNSPLRGASVDPAGDRLYFRDSGRSPPDVWAVPLSPSGAIGELFNSPYHGDLPTATQTTPFPAGGRVIDNSGTVYRGSDLVQLGNLAGSFDAIAFNGEAPIVLRGAKLVRYSTSYAPLGEFTLDAAADAVAFKSGSVYAFRSLGAGQIDTDVVALADFAVPVAPAAPFPDGLAYTPTDMVASDSGSIFLLSRSNRAVFRWSLVGGGYRESISLSETPDHIAWLNSVDSLFIGYPSGRISKVRVGQNSQTEEHFTNSPNGMLGLGDAGDFLVACDYGGPWAAHYTYDATTAERTSWMGWNHIAPEYVFSPALRRVFFLSDYASHLSYESVAPGGALSQVVRSFDYVNFAPNGAPERIRLNPAGTIAAIGDGQIFDATSLARLAELPHGFEDAAWLGTNLFTVTGNSVTTTAIEEFDPYRQLVRSATLPGIKPRIFAFGAQLVVVTQWSGRPRFTVLQPAPGDLDGDGVLDAADAFPADQAEHSDRDGDTVGDNADAFPDDPTETADSDDDGIGDNADAFPNDPDEVRDTDSDGVGDVEDAFPLDPNETVDSDDDGIGDNGDAFPEIPTEGDADVLIDQRLKVTGYGRFGGGGEGDFHFLPDNVFALCSEGECDFGEALATGKKNNKWTLLWSPESIALLGDVLEEVVEGIVSDETGEVVDLEVDPASAKVKATAKLSRDGKQLITTLKVKFTGHDVGRNKKLKMSYAMQATGPYTPPR